MKLMNARGTKDFSPAEKIMRNKVVDTLRRIFELYGYSPLQTPIIERLDVLTAKYAGGSEILKETFQLKDQGGRELGLRYDLTVPFSRFVGMNPHVKMPFKRYQIGRVYRDGPVKLGRMREFYQCDVDIVGSKSMMADAECVMIAQRVFAELGLDVYIEVSNRKVLNGIIKECGIAEQMIEDIIVTIDKFKKLSEQEIEKEMRDKGLQAEQIDKLFEIFKFRGGNDEKITYLKKVLTNEEGKKGIEEIEEVLSYCSGDNVEFSLSLARGLAYYTSTVFEVFMKDSDFRSSLGAGGRYDKMIGGLLGVEKEYPALGISFGLEPILAMLQKEGKITEQRTVTKLFMIPIGTQKDCVRMAEDLRTAGVKVEVDIAGRGISKNLNYANALGIPFVAFVGEEEIKQGKIKVKDMVSGEEGMLSVAEVIKKLVE